ncbi:MAG: hypothetical protein H7X88_03935 [Gloeobacteraceae cyanobacterium ES-bin-316]|nr:hypothetical protein [Ferruginibacter sp.]
MMLLTATDKFSERNKLILKFMFFVLLAIYVINCFTPLRLHYDSVRYLAIKDCIEFGCPPDSDAARDYFPFGYTAWLLILSKLGILSSISIVVTNCLFLLGGLYFISKVFEKKISPYLYFIIVLLNWLFIKFVTHPLSEMEYVFFSSGSIYFFYLFTRGRKIVFLFCSLLFCWLAFVTKTVGITLVGALAFGLIWEFKESQLAFLKKNKFLIVGLLILIAASVVLFAKQLGLNHYIGVLSKHLNEAPFFTRVAWRFTEWGELFLNTPSNKVVERLPGLGQILFISVGVIVFSFFCIFLYFKKNTIPAFIKAYFLFYLIIMFNWPFNDPRFWVPVMPVMAAIVLQAPLGINYFYKFSSRLLLAVYFLLGFTAAGYMIYSSNNKAFFAKNQAKGFYKKEYEMHFFNKDPKGAASTLNSSDTIRTVNIGDSVKIVNPYIMGLLKRYN